jgi:hypothetical protein
MAKATDIFETMSASIFQVIALEYVFSRPEELEDLFQLCFTQVSQ